MRREGKGKIKGGSFLVDFGEGVGRKVVFVRKSGCCCDRAKPNERQQAK